MKSTFSIIFYLKRQVVKKDGTVPVMGRITVDGTQAQFSCKTTANPDLWDTKGGRMIGKSMQALEVNRKLDKMRVSISKHYQEIMDRDNFVTADKVKNAFLPMKNHTFLLRQSPCTDFARPKKQRRRPGAAFFPLLLFPVPGRPIGQTRSEFQHDDLPGIHVVRKPVGSKGVHESADRIPDLPVAAVGDVHIEFSA